MNSYRDLDIYKMAFDLAFRLHKASLDLPKFELYEQGSQLEMLIALYPEMSIFQILFEEYDILGRKINTYIDYVEKNWKT